MRGFFVILILFSIPSYASEGGTGWRNITGFGCHLHDGTCYIDIDGDPVGLSSCLGTNIRFDTASSVNGKVWVSLISTAYASNKKIQLNISGCYDNGTFPTFNYGRIEK